MLVLVQKLCKALMKDFTVHYEWLGVLPLLHVITIKDFATGQPVKLPLHQNEVYSMLFCGLETQGTLGNFVTKAMTR